MREREKWVAGGGSEDGFWVSKAAEARAAERRLRVQGWGLWAVLAVVLLKECVR